MRLVRLAAVSLAAFGLGGCVVAAAGAAGYGAAKYFGNGDDRTYPAPVGPVVAAVVESLREQGYPVAGDVQPGPGGIVLRANDAKVDVQSIDGATTRVTASVGTFGSQENERRASAILEGVSRRLGQGAP